jgi:hypothetical protein
MNWGNSFYRLDLDHHLIFHDRARSGTIRHDQARSGTIRHDQARSGLPESRYQVARLRKRRG